MMPVVLNDAWVVSTLLRLQNEVFSSFVLTSLTCIDLTVS